METITLPDTNLTVSKFIFGTAALFNAGFADRRRELLFAAVDAGFTHFDTAPYYGFGVAECDLAPLLKANPHATLTTKVGIYAPGGEDQAAPAVFLRKVAGRFVKQASQPTIDFSLARARKALEGSLRRTGRETIDIYVIHEPAFMMVTGDEWLRWLESCVVSGKVRYFGIAPKLDDLGAFLSASSGLCRVIQTKDYIGGPMVEVLQRHRRKIQITYGYVAAALQSSTPIDIRTILKQALMRNRSGAIIVSTRNPSRLAQYAEAQQELLDAE